ncbi:1304_t:CDS:2 [Entrophospora sp. SA101]|nr:5374_t:CDS:2 [Entrophospora sp. SA101]CAJ0833788.1 5380_t:CDS:2 [Entrophospora sp. SA101]CAJ0838889.1 1304_t:CDS:2 [Entrophospora sp. SA101]
MLEIGDDHFRSNRNQHLKKFINNVNKDFNYSTPNLFITSDVTKDSNLITPLIEALPCSYMLLDFDPLLEPYRTLVNPIDNKILHKFLLPLTDLMVAARASNIYSMHASTFVPVKISSVLNEADKECDAVFTDVGFTGS